MRKVPDELLTSLTYHWPLEHQNSQCLRLTTLDLKPTIAADEVLGVGVGFASRSEYRPTLITEVLSGSVREIGANVSEGLAERGS